MLDFNDFQPMGESLNPIQNQSDLNNQEKNEINDIFTNLNKPQINEEEKKEYQIGKKKRMSVKLKLIKKFKRRKKQGLK